MNFDVTGNDIKYCLRYSVFDVRKGLLLKLGEGQEVLGALMGRKKLSFSEIRAIYGSASEDPRVDIDWPNLGRDDTQNWPNYVVFQNFFEACKAPLIMIAIDLIDRKKLE